MAFPRCDTCGEMAREVFRCECDFKREAELLRQRDALKKAMTEIKEIANALTALQPKGA